MCVHNQYYNTYVLRISNLVLLWFLIAPHGPYNLHLWYVHAPCTHTHIYQADRCAGAHQHAVRGDQQVPLLTLLAPPRCGAAHLRRPL